MSDNLSLAFHTLVRCNLTPVSGDKILLLRYMNRATNFMGLSLKIKIACFCLKHINSVLFAFS